MPVLRERLVFPARKREKNLRQTQTEVAILKRRFGPWQTAERGYLQGPVPPLRVSFACSLTPPLGSYGLRKHAQQQPMAMRLCNLAQHPRCCQSVNYRRSAHQTRGNVSSAKCTAKRNTPAPSNAPPDAVNMISVSA